MRQLVKSKTDLVLSRLKLLSLEMFVVLIAFVCSLFAVVFFVRQVFWEKKDAFDFRVFDFFQQYVSDGLTTVMNCFTFFGGQYFLIPANLFLIGYSFFVKKEKWFTIKIA